MSTTSFAGLALLLAIGVAPGLKAQTVTLEGGKYLAVDRDTAKSQFAGVIMQFDGDTTYWIEQAGNAMILGALRVKGDMLTFGDDDGPLACRATATYRISRGTKGIRLDPVSDACAGRAAGMAGLEWIKQP